MDVQHVQFEINPAKIREYLLNPDHPKGKSKAKWLLSRGFDYDNLAFSLVRHGREGRVVKEENTEFGVFITIEGILNRESEPVANFRSVWERMVEQNKCRFGTAYPI